VRRRQPEACSISHAPTVCFREEEDFRPVFPFSGAVIISRDAISTSNKILVNQVPPVGPADLFTAATSKVIAIHFFFGGQLVAIALRRHAPLPSDGGGKLDKRKFTSSILQPLSLRTRPRQKINGFSSAVATINEIDCSSKKKKSRSMTRTVKDVERTT
jgi:hypothetical protein